MREQVLQSKKIKQLEDAGYYVIKLSKTNKNGIPDLIAIPPNSDVLFVEIKTPRRNLTTLQKFRMKELNQIGIKTEIYNGIEQDPDE